jgi:hypothetical protein
VIDLYRTNSIVLPDYIASKPRWSLWDRICWAFGHRPIDRIVRRLNLAHSKQQYSCDELMVHFGKWLQHYSLQDSWNLSTCFLDKSNKLCKLDQGRPPVLLSVQKDFYQRLRDVGFNIYLVKADYNPPQVRCSLHDPMNHSFNNPPHKVLKIL